QPARVTVVVRVRPPESGSGGNSATTSGQQHDVVVFPAVGSQNTIVVDRDGAEARCVYGDMRDSFSGPNSFSGQPGSASGGGGNGNTSGPTFTFDRVFWSMQAGSKGRERQGSLSRSPAPYASQNCVFEGIGQGVVESCLAGFNTCLFAYGQTGSGKTFTMMGAGPSGPAAAKAIEATAIEITEQQVRAVTPPPPPVEMMALKPQQQASDEAVAESDTQEATVSKHPSDSDSNISNDGGTSTSNATTSEGTSGIRPRPIVTGAQLSNNSNSGGSGSSDSSGKTRNKNKNNSSTTTNSTSEGSSGVSTDGPGGTGGANRGVIPRICDFLFERAEAVTAEANATVVTGGPEAIGEVEGSTRAGNSAINSSAGVLGKQSGVSTRWTFSVSFTEIYMERVRDLLDTSGRANQNLKARTNGQENDAAQEYVREHPTKGPFVEGVVTATVTTARETERLLVEGQARRAVAGTNMNETSSRSHAIFTIVATKVERDLQTGAEGFTTSKVNLVDLAGSENANTAGSAGTRLKEGAAINKSLLTLGRVIKALVDASTEGRPRVIPSSSPRKSEQRFSGNAGVDESLPDPLPLLTVKKFSSNRSLLNTPSPVHGLAPSPAAAAAAAAAASLAAVNGEGSVAGHSRVSSIDGVGKNDDGSGRHSRIPSGGGDGRGRGRGPRISRRRSSGSMQDHRYQQQILSPPSSPPPRSPFASPPLSPCTSPPTSPRSSIGPAGSSPRVPRRDGGGDGGGGGLRQSIGGGGRVPYRESVLTFLLKDSLGGNSHTTMIATIRPGVRFLEETMSTLRYADQAKSIVNSVKVNEDPFARTVRRLQEEISALKRELASSRRQESLARAQADGLKREIDLLQVVDATLIASIKRHDNNTGHGVTSKVPQSLEGCGESSNNNNIDGRDGNIGIESTFGDVTPQLTPMPPPDGAGEPRFEEEEVKNASPASTLSNSNHEEESEEQQEGNAGGTTGIPREGGDEGKAVWAIRKNNETDEASPTSAVKMLRKGQGGAFAPAGGEGGGEGERGGERADGGEWNEEETKLLVGVVQEEEHDTGSGSGGLEGSVGANERTSGTVENAGPCLVERHPRRNAGSNSSDVPDNCATTADAATVTSMERMASERRRVNEMGQGTSISERDKMNGIDAEQKREQDVDIRDGETPLVDSNHRPGSMVTNTAVEEGDGNRYHSRSDSDDRVPGAEPSSGPNIEAAEAEKDMSPEKQRKNDPEEGAVRVLSDHTDAADGIDAVATSKEAGERANDDYQGRDTVESSLGDKVGTNDEGSSRVGNDGGARLPMVLDLNKAVAVGGEGRVEKSGKYGVMPVWSNFGANDNRTTMVALLAVVLLLDHKKSGNFFDEILRQHNVRGGADSTTSTTTDVNSANGSGEWAPDKRADSTTAENAGAGAQVASSTAATAAAAASFVATTAADYAARHAAAISAGEMRSQADFIGGDNIEVDTSQEVHKGERPSAAGHGIETTQPRVITSSHSLPSEMTPPAPDGSLPDSRSGGSERVEEKKDRPRQGTAKQGGNSRNGDGPTINTRHSRLRRKTTSDVIGGNEKLETAEELKDQTFGHFQQTRLFETSGFLLGQSWPPLPTPPPPAPSMATPTASTDINAHENNEEWCRRWYILQRGKLTAFSGWGGNHTCVGKMALKGCSVEDAPEKVPEGAPFAFRVRAQQCARNDDSPGASWTLQASTRQEKSRWMNAIRGAADREMDDVSSLGSPLNADDPSFVDADSGRSGGGYGKEGDASNSSSGAEQHRILDMFRMSATAQRGFRESDSDSGDSRNSVTKSAGEGVDGKPGATRGSEKRAAGGVGLTDGGGELELQSSTGMVDAPVEDAEAASIRERSEEWGQEGRSKSCVFQ
ncbi:unnamed protein product, partial [Ectocarpus sp. 4 AP-2014]